MSYLDSHARTSGPTKNSKLQPTGRVAKHYGVFVGYVKDVSDIQRNGRLQVWIAEFASAPDNPNGWITVNYCSPFAGATNEGTESRSDIQSFEGTQTSYGFWMVPPDINNQVLVMFINGDASRGIWIGSLYNQYMNNMIPAMAANAKNYQYPGKKVPVAEYNKWDLKVTHPDSAMHPFERTKFQGVANQGLIKDEGRGITNSSARREAPSNVFGIITPGPPINPNAKQENIRRKGGSSFIMDDGTGTEYVELATKTGSKIRLDETNGFVYIVNRDGTAWIQIDQKGNIDVFSARDISLRAQRDFNIRADRNVNIEAGQDIYIKAAKDTVQSTTSFTYDINNIPKPSNIPYWKYVGEGAGAGGNIVMQSLNDWHSTTKNNAYISVDQMLNIWAGNGISMTSIGGGGTSVLSKSGIKLTTEGSYDLGVKGNLRIGVSGTYSTTSAGALVLCTTDQMSLNGNAGVAISSASKVGITGETVFDNDVIAPGFGLGSGAIQPSSPQPVMSASTSPKAEVKLVVDKINILATWQDPPGKFKRNSEHLKTTVTRFPTYEPCPEHEEFKFTSITGYIVPQNQSSRTYAGSGGAGGTATSSPPTSTTPGSNNTKLQPTTVDDSVVTKDFNMAAYQCQLKNHEGIKYVSYIDSVGKPTGGIGHLLRDNELSLYPVPTPISEEQVTSWFNQDASSSITGAQELLGIDTWGELSDNRKRACADLCYNLGKNGLSKFKTFLGAMKSGDYQAAGAALKDSLWYRQVGRRGPDIIAMIVQDVDPLGCDRKFPPT